MSAPQLAEGTLTIDCRSGGDYVILQFGNGASVMMSRNLLFETNHLIGQHIITEHNEVRSAEIVAFPVASMQ